MPEKKLVNLVLGEADDDCPICKAAKEGKSQAEIAKLFGIELQEGETLETLDLTEKKGEV